MENRSYAIAVGLFTLLLGLFLLFSFWWLSGDHQKNIEYVVISPLPVTGLSVESAVKFRGVDVGKVTAIQLDESNKNTIRIQIRVAENLALSSASSAELRMQGVTGLAYIDLNDTSEQQERLPAGAEIPLVPSLMDKLLSGGPALVNQIEVLITNTNALASTANQLLASVDQEKLNNTLSHLENASEKLGPLLQNASITVERMGKMASAENQILLHDTLSSMQKTAEAAQPLLNELSDTARDFRGMAKGIEQSSLQLTHTLHHETLPRIHDLSESMQRDLRQFGQILDTLNDNPQSLILGKPPLKPGPGEAGFQTPTDNQ